MKHRILIIDTLVVLIVTAVFILWHNSTGTEHSAEAISSVRNNKIYLITMDNQDQFWYAMNNGASDMANLLGVTYTWLAPDQKDTEKQIELLNRAVDEGAKAIMIAANDPIRISSAIEDAKAKSVKILYVDSPAYEEAVITLSTDNYLAGSAAARTMLEELAAVGVTSGKLGIISVNKTTDSTLKREQGFRDVINKDGRFTILDTLYENGDPLDSQNAAEGLINNENNLVALFGTNEGSSVGVGNAIKESNKSVIGIGFDKSKPILALLKGGYLKDILVQNPYTMGYLGMAEAVAALLGHDTGPSSLDTGISIVSSQ